jgi:AcrR family transcriptional regulator
VRNRTSILDAAVLLTQSQGGDVSVDAVARQAGVAVGTVYRHWPSKQDLLRSVLLRRLGAVASEAEAADSLEQFLVRLTEYCVQEPTLLALLDDAGGPGGPFGEAAAGRSAAASTDPERAALRERLERALGRLIARARAHGQLRQDVRPGDVRVYLVGLRAALLSGDPDAWRRHRDIYSAGLLRGTDPEVR